jgi:hypothetical protein
VGLNISKTGGTTVMADLFPPTFISPSGGESIATSSVVIKWENPETPDSEGNDVSYDLFYSINHRESEEPKWRAIATLPSQTNSFNWKIPGFLRSENLRLGIRTRNVLGELSRMSLTSSSITIYRRSIKSPRILLPLTNGRYSEVVEVVVDTDSSFELFYESKSSGIALTSIDRKFPASGNRVMWNVTSLPPADDYFLRVASADSNDEWSPLSSVGPFSIVQEGFFIADTLPPKASLRIEGGDLFTNTRDIGISVFAYDEATEPSSMTISGVGATFEGSFRSQFVFSFAEDELDGIKTISADVSDKGKNKTSELSSSKQINLDILRITEGDVVDQCPGTFGNDDVIYAVTKGKEKGLFVCPLSVFEQSIPPSGLQFSANVNDLESVLFPRRLARLDDKDEPIAITQHTAEIYLSVTTSGNGRVIKRVAGGWSEVLLLSGGVRCNSLLSTLDGLYLGLSTGEVRKFDGITTQLICSYGSSGNILDPATSSDHPVKKLTINNGMISVSYDNSEKIVGIVQDTPFELSRL